MPGCIASLVCEKGIWFGLAQEMTMQSDLKIGFWITVGVACVAVVMLLLSPLWALQFRQTPFIGAFLEPHNVVSAIEQNYWPARLNGVRFGDRLLAVNGEPVENSRQLSRLLRANGFAPVELTFARPDSAALQGISLQADVPVSSMFTVVITPVVYRWNDFFLAFGIPWLVGLVFLVIGLWVLYLRPREQSARAFAIFSFSVSLVLALFFDLNTWHFATGWWSFALYLTAVTLAQLGLLYPRPVRLYIGGVHIRTFLWIPGLLLGFWSARVVSDSFPMPYQYILAWRWGYLALALSILWFAGMLLWRALYSDDAAERQQSRVIVFGNLIATMPLLFFLLKPYVLGGDTVFRQEVYFPFLIFLPITVAYSVLRYRLLDVDAIFNRLVSSIVTGLAGILLFYLFLGGLSGLQGRAVGAADPTLIALFLLALTLVLIPLQHRIQKAINRFFYRPDVDYANALSSLADHLTTTPDIAGVLRILEKYLQQILQPAWFVVYLYDEEAAAFVPHTPADIAAPVVGLDIGILEIFKETHRAFWYPPDAPLPDALLQYANADSLRGAALAPIWYENRLIGTLVLGPRSNAVPYSTDDLEFLDALAGQSALALENSRLFTNLQRTYERTVEMKNLMDDIFNSMATGVITADLEQKITLFNRAAEQILGLPLKDVLGKPLSSALPAASSHLLRLSEHALNEQKTVVAEVEDVLPHRGEVHLRFSCLPLKDAHEAVNGISVVIEDLTERKHLVEQQERILQTFGRVVAPRVRDRLLAAPENLTLTGDARLVSVLFADLRGFTSFSEKHAPEEVFDVLNRYLSMAAEMILAQEGTIDKFMGDAVMAFWNAPDDQPDHAWRAVQAAWEIATRSSREEYSELTFRVGVATGRAMLGNVGMTNLFNYTAIGDIVNCAERLQSLADPGQVLISSATWQQVASFVEAQPREAILRGRENPETVYRILSLKK
jgi:PAS domain S-box-containing protein